MPRIDDDGEEALCLSGEGEGEDETEEPPEDHADHETTGGELE